MPEKVLHVQPLPCPAPTERAPAQGPGPGVWAMTLSVSGHGRGAGPPWTSAQGRRQRSQEDLRRAGESPDYSIVPSPGRQRELSGRTGEGPGIVGLGLCPARWSLHTSPPSLLLPLFAPTRTHASPHRRREESGLAHHILLLGGNDISINPGACLPQSPSKPVRHRLRAEKN